MPRYCVFTYQTPFENEPYQESSTDDLATAKKYFELAKEWNYMVVLFDGEKTKNIETYQSGIEHPYDWEPFILIGNGL
ncbi:MAG: hypothetical protein ACFB2X_03120 [Rivularia sp. (in: cyanobacteria)]